MKGNFVCARGVGLDFYGRAKKKRRKNGWEQEVTVQLESGIG